MTTPAALVRRTAPAAPRFEAVEPMTRVAPEHASTLRPPYLRAVPPAPPASAAPPTTGPAARQGAAHDHPEAANAPHDGKADKAAKKGQDGKDAKHAGDAHGGHGHGAAAPGGAHGAGSARKRGRRGAEESDEDAPRLDKIPSPDADMPRLDPEPFSLPEADVAFDAPTDLPLRPEPAAKPQPPTRETTSYRAVFAEAAQAARRLHDALVGDAAQLASEARRAASAHASARQADLDASLLAMDGGLADARSSLGTSTDAALALIDSRAAAARGRIRRAAGGARAALKTEQTRIETARKGPADRQAQIIARAGAYTASVDVAGILAQASLTLLGNSPSTYYPSVPAGLAGDGALCGDAVLEAIVTRVPTRAGHRLKAYTEEFGKQATAMATSFKSLPQEFAAAFATVDDWIQRTSKAGPDAVDSAAGSALHQLDTMTRKMRTSIATAHDNAETALIHQHAAARKQATAVHRNRSHGEAQAESRRASHDLSSLRALATAQGVSLRVVIDGLRRETRRGEKDFARVVISTSRAFARRVESTDTLQRPQLRVAAALGADAADRQSAAAGERLVASAQALGHQFVDTAGDSGRAIEEQANEGTAGLKKLAEPVSAVIGSYLPPIAKAFDCQICRLGSAVDSTGQRVDDYMAGKSSPAAAAKCGCPDTPAPAAVPAPAAAKDGPTMVPADFVTMGTKVGRNPTTDARIQDLESRAKEDVPKKMVDKVAAVWDGAGAIHTNTEQVMSALRAITAAQGTAIKLVFQHQHHRNIETYLRLYLPKVFSARSTDKFNVDAAINYLNGNAIEGALNDLKAAVNYSNEEARVETIQRSLTPAQWAELKGLHGAEIKDVRDDLDGVDQQVFDALEGEGDHFRMVGKQAELFAPTGLGEGVAKADALRLREQMGRDLKKRGDTGADKAVDTLAGAQGRSGADVLSGKDALDLDERQVDADAPGFDKSDPVAERNAKQWQRTKEAFDQLEQSDGATKPKDAKAGWSIAAFAGKTRDYDVYVPNRPGQYPSAGRGQYGGGGHYETVHEHIESDQQRLMQYIVDYGADSEEAAAARLMVETRRDGGQPKPERLDMAMHANVLDAREGEDKSALPEQEKKSRMKQAHARQQGVLLKYDELRRNQKLASDAAKPGDAPPPAPTAAQAAEQKSTAERVRKELTERVTAQGDASTRKLNERTMREPAPDWDAEQTERITDAKAGIDFAMEHKSKRGETLKRTMGRLDRSEVDAAFADWEKDHPGRSLDKELNLGGQGSWWTEKVSGDERQDIELLRLGVAKNDLERAEVSRMRAQQQIRDAGWLGKLAGKVTGDYDALEASRDGVESSMGLPHGAFDAFGRSIGKGSHKGNFDEKGKYKPPAGGSAAQFELALHMTHITAESYKAMTDRVANAVVTGLMVAAAVITTALTGGAAASIWIPVLVTMGAGLVGIALAASIKGARYSRADMERDLVMTFVQAATAGLGAAAGVAIKGGMPALRAVASEMLISEKVLETVIEQAGAKGLSKGWALVAEMGIGAMSNATNNAAAAAMDPVARAQGESGSKALDAGLTGFFSGAFGSALMKPVGALGKAGLGHYGERAFGAAANNVATRAFEIGVEEHRGTGERRQTADITDDLTGAGVQGLAQGALEQAASNHTDARRAVAAARAAGVPEPHAASPAHTAAPHEPAATHAPAAVHEPVAPRAAIERPSAPAADREMPVAPARAQVEPPIVPASLSHVADAARSLVPDSPPPLLEHGVTPPAPPPGAAVPEPVMPGGGRRAGEPDEAPSKAAAGKDKADRARPPPLPTEAHSGVQWASDEFMEGVVMMDANPHDRTAVEATYRNAIKTDPSREVGIYRNPITGEHILIFGDPTAVFIGLNRALGEAPHGAESPALRQDWKEILHADVGRWELEAHYHPGKPGEHNEARMWRRLPSTGEGGVGDMQAMRQESHAAGGKPRSSVIHFTHEGQEGFTRFGFDPGEPEPYWVDVEHPDTKVRELRRFATTEAYEAWAGSHDAAPNLDAPGAPHEEQVVLRHGTTNEHAEALRDKGIDVHRKPGDAEDYGRGFYMTSDEANANLYAEKRSKGGPGKVLSTSMPLSELGVVVDVREGGQHRAQWDEFLDRKPIAFPSEFAGLFDTARDYVKGKGNGSFVLNEIQRGAVFEAFLHEAGLAHADAIRGDLGTVMTSGIAANSTGGQIAIRSQGLADKLNERLGLGPKGRPSEEPVIPGAGAKKEAPPPERVIGDPDIHADVNKTFDALDQPAPPKTYEPSSPRSEAQENQAAKDLASAQRTVDLEGLEDFLKRSSKQTRVDFENLRKLDPENVEAAFRSQVVGGEAEIAEAREYRTTELGLPADEVEATMQRWRRASEDGALARFEAKLIKDGHPPARAAKQRELLRQMLQDGLRTAVGAARERAAWQERIERPAKPADRLTPRQEAFAREFPGMFAAAVQEPDLFKERFERMQQKSPRTKLSAARFKKKWEAYLTSIRLPLVSENQATFRLGKERHIDLFELNPVSVANKDNFVNKGGIDIIGVERFRPYDVIPEKVKVYLIDDKAEQGTNLGKVSAQTENLGQNLLKHAGELGAKLEQHRQKGVAIEPAYERAVKQLTDAAQQIEELDKGRIGRGGKTPRYRQERYIDAVKDILKVNNIHMEITSEHGNIKTLAKWLERYGFRMAFDDEDARDKEPLTPAISPGP